MIGILTFLAFLALTAIYFFSTKHKIFQKDKYDDIEIAPGGGRRLAITLGIFLLGIVIAIIQPLSIERVDAGGVGIKAKLIGDNRGVSKYEYKTGWVILNDWTERLYEYPTAQRHIVYDEQSVITKGGFSASIKPTFNYSLKPGGVGDMFQNLRLPIAEIEKQWLNTAVVGAINDVANKWQVDDIFNKREQFESDIVNEANRRVNRWFVLSQLRTNITPPKALQEAIEAKTRAIQEAQAAENQKLVAIAQGDKKVAEARADSAQRVIRAAGESEEMRRKQLNLTPQYIEYIKWVNANSDLPRVPQVVAGSGSGLLYNLK